LGYLWIQGRKLLMQLKMGLWVSRKPTGTETICESNEDRVCSVRFGPGGNDEDKNDSARPGGLRGKCLPSPNIWV
jgi:hypothetical protein